MDEMRMMRHVHVVPTTATMDTNSSMGVQFYFYFGSSMTLLFSEWSVTKVQDLVGSIFAMFFLAVFYEGLKSFRGYLTQVAIRSLSTTCCADSKPVTAKCNWRNIFDGVSKLAVILHGVQSVLHVVQTGVAYLLMLAVMVFNGWIFLAVVFGEGVGYLLFAWTKFLYRNGSLQDSNDCCS